MDLTTISIGVAIANVIALITGAVWAVGKINTTTAVLKVVLENNSKATHELSVTMKALDQTLNGHETRLSLLEQGMIRT